MRTEDVDRIRRVSEWMRSQAEIDHETFERVGMLCYRADMADSDGRACQRDDLIAAALDILFRDEE